MTNFHFTKCAIFFALLIITCKLSAQNRVITGIVRDDDKKETLINASVTILHTSSGTTTDADGKFKIFISSKIASPKLVIFYSGYKADTVTLTTGKSFYNISLKSANSALNEVVVTGFSRQVKIREDPTSIRIVSTKQIEQTVQSNILDNLTQNVPGFNVLKTGPNVSKPFIRGLGYSRVETLYDGVPQEGQQFEDEEVLAIDGYAIDKAEVLLGPTTLMFGPDALAGLVNLIPSLPGNTNKTLEGKFFSEYQSNNGMYGNALRFNYGSSKWAFTVRGAYKFAKNYQNSVDGRVYNTGFREKDLSASLVHTSTNGYTSFNAGLYDNSQGIPDGSRDSLTRKFTKQISDFDDDEESRPVVSNAELNSYKLSPVYQHIQHYRIYTKSQYDFQTAGSLYAMASFQQNLRKEYDFPNSPDLLGVSAQLNSYNYDFRYQLPKINNYFENTIGVNGLYQTDKEVNATDIPIPDYHLFDFGAFFFTKWKKDRVTISGGLRYDNRHITGNDFYTRTDDNDLTRHVTGADTVGADLLFPAFNKNYHGISGDLGATYRVSDMVSIKANIARGTGAPHVSEFASNGLDGSAHSYFIGKEDLTPEYNWQEDLGIIFDTRDVSATVSIFNNYLQSYIYLIQLVDANGNPIELIPGNKTFQYHQSAAQLYGIEGIVTIHPRSARGLIIQTNFATMYGFNRDPEFRGKGNQGEYLPTVPPFRALNSLAYEARTKSHVVPLITFRAEADVNGAQTRYLALNQTETATPGYTLVNASVNFTVRYTKKFPLQFQLAMNNILDKAYQSNLSRLKYFEQYSASPNGHLGIYSMGRNGVAKLIMPF
jgi:iron complex outermembrane receptor protein